MNESTNNQQSRDAASLRILGSFIGTLGGLVLVGTVWTLDDYRAVVVNLASGGVLTAIGIGMFLVGRRIARRRSREVDLAENR